MQSPKNQEEKQKMQLILHSGMQLKKENHITVKPRGKRVLMVSSPSGSWTVIEGLHLNYWRKLGQQNTVEKALSLEDPLTEKQRSEFIMHMFRKGMLSINGRSYFSSGLWKTEREYPSFLCLHLTEACNFGCKYCMAESVPQKASMPIAIMEKILYKCLHELPLNNFTFDFHGGEPIMAWDSIVHAVKYLKEINTLENLKKEIDVFFQTNASLLDDEKIAFLVENHIRVGVSLDGPKEVHDRNRIFANSKDKGTFDTVIAKIERAESLGLKVGLLSVIHNPEDFLKTFRFMTDQMKAKSFRMNYSSYIGRSAKLLDFPLDRSKEFAKYWLLMVDEAYKWCKDHDTNLNICDVNNQINNLVSKNRPFMCYRSPCGVVNSVLGFAIDGGIHACEEMASSGNLRLANINDPDLNLADMVRNNQLAQDLQKRTVDNIPRCKRCYLRHICSAGCTSKTLSFFGDYMREDPMCGYYQIVFEELMWKLTDNPDMVRRLGGGMAVSPHWRPIEPIKE